MNRRLFVYLPGMLMPPNSMQRIYNSLKQEFPNDVHEIFDIGMMAPQGPSYSASKTKEFIQKRMDAETFGDVVLVGESWGGDIAIMVSEQLNEVTLVIAGEPGGAGFYVEEKEWKNRLEESRLRYDHAIRQYGPIGVRAIKNTWAWHGTRNTWRRINNLHEVEKPVVILAGYGGEQPTIPTGLKSDDFVSLQSKVNIRCFNLRGGGHKVLNREAEKISGLTLSILHPNGNT